jgi:anthranilate synthase component I
MPWIRPPVRRRRSEAEYQETINKSKALLAAAEEAVRFASAAKKGQ